MEKVTNIFITVSDMRTNMSATIKYVEKNTGTSIILTRDNKEVAVLMSMQEFHRLKKLEADNGNTTTQQDGTA